MAEQELDASLQLPERFLLGVIEGFYGPPWTPAERSELLGWMRAWGLNTYFYAPKDDLKHRMLWRENYSENECSVLEDLIASCTAHGVRFIYGIAPGLDIRYSGDADAAALDRRMQQLAGLGCRNFALLFDDIPDRMDPADVARWGSLAAAQAHVARRVGESMRRRNPDGRLLFCPTPYCARMAERGHGGAGYLAILGAELPPEVDVFWTGPEIISREITVPHLREVTALLRRKPVLWDNLHANDYDGRRFYCGPYAGRPVELLGEVGGLLINPNTEFPLNFMALRTLSAFAQAADRWVPRDAYLSAMREWLPHFATAGRPIEIDDLIAFGDCFYLPYDDGPTATHLHALARRVLAGPGPDWERDAAEFRAHAGRLRDTCARMAELLDRPLFHALSRRAWELREELDLLERYVGSMKAGCAPEPGPVFDFHLPGTYRGGWVARLQQLLEPCGDGRFRPASRPLAPQRSWAAMTRPEAKP